jgi:hypothetical protein
VSERQISNKNVQGVRTVV